MVGGIWCGESAYRLFGGECSLLCVVDGVRRVLASATLKYRVLDAAFFDVAAARPVVRLADNLTGTHMVNLRRHGPIAILSSLSPYTSFFRHQHKVVKLGTVFFVDSDISRGGFWKIPHTIYSPIM